MRNPINKAILESVETRRLHALIGPDLLGAGMSITPNDPVPQGGEVTINFSIKNDGGLWGDSGAFWVHFWRSSENPIGQEYLTYTRVTEVKVDRLSKGATYNGSVTISSPGGNENNQAYIFMQIDTYNAQGEWNESNNWLTGLGKDVAGYSTEADLDAFPSTEKETRGNWMSLNGTLWGEIGGSEGIGSADYDIYHLNLTAGQKYMVDIDRNSGLDSYVRVYDMYWNLVAQNDNGRDEGEAAGVDSYAEWRPGASGTYHIVVSNNWNTSSDPRVMGGRTYGGSTGGYYISVHQIHNPIVRSEVLDGWTTEGSDSAKIRIHRTGSPDNSLFVGWGLGGSANYGSEYTLSASSIVNNEGVIIPAGQQYVDVTITALDDGIWEDAETVRFYFHEGASYYLGSTGMTSLVEIANSTTDRPRVVSMYDIFDDNYGQRVIFNFDENVAHSLSIDDFVLTNLQTNQTVDRSKMSVIWTASNNQAWVRFNGFANGMLPNGDYRLTLIGSGVTNGGGQTLESNVSSFVFSLAGDANRDRKVDFSDLLILAQNYGGAGKQLGSGNVDYSTDGKVDFNDLLLLAQNYGKSLLVPLMAGTFGNSEIRAKGARTSAVEGLV